jgi:site-specific recombinase XerD
MTAFGPQSINSFLTCVRAYANWLHTEGHLPEKPRVPLLKFEQKVITTFSSEQVKKLLSRKPKGANQFRVHVATCLRLDTGLRLQGGPGLTPADADFDNLLVKVTGKGNKQRMVRSQPRCVAFSTGTASKCAARSCSAPATERK